MRRQLSTAIGLCMGIMLVFAVSVAAAQSQKEKRPASRGARADGTIQSIDKDTKTISVRLRGKNIQQQVVYGDKTRFTFRNKPSSFDEVKAGRRVICVGEFNDKRQLIARRIDVRDKM